MKKNTFNDKQQATPGPKAETLRLKGDWEDLIGKALEKERPKDGWPDKKQGDDNG